MKETQEDFITEILTLKQHNPALDIWFCVDSEEVLGWGWTAHRITKVGIRPWLAEDERIYTDEDEIREHFCDLEDCELSESELESRVNDRYAKEVKQVICVFTHEGA